MLLGGRPIFLMSLRRQLVTEFHQASYLGATKRTEFLRPRYYVPQIKCITFRYAICAQLNPKDGRKTPQRIQVWGTLGVVLC